MREKSIGIKWKKRLGRWLAMAMTISLLAGQCSIPALAEEDSETGLESSVSDNDIEDSIENNISQCVCTEKCSEESVNGECAVCLADYKQCGFEIVEEGISEELPDLEEELPDIEDVVLEETQESEETEALEAADEITVYTDGEIVIDGIQYRVTNADAKEVEVIGPKTLSGDVVIPEIINGEWRVIGIGEEAFARYGFDTSYLTGIQIPESVKYIGDSAFQGCINLTKVSIPNGVTSIGTSAFEACWELTDIIIPGSVASIGSRAFCECSSMTGVEIQDSAVNKSIGDEAFRGCSSLVRAEFPDSVTEIGYYTFVGCKLTEFRIPTGIRGISQGMFCFCQYLTDITIPDNITYIGGLAFGNCTSLTNITIPDSVTQLQFSVFENCTSLTHITIPDSVTTIGDRAFRGSGLNDVIVPASVTSIGKNAFEGCSSLISATIMSGCTAKIPAYLFKDCVNLNTVTMPDSVERMLEQDPFSGCTRLENLRIAISKSDPVVPIKVEADARYVFGDCPENRYISFLTADGTAELIGDAYETARIRYKNVKDADYKDNKWYGWNFSSQTGTDSSYKVTINVHKDNTEWLNHGKTFALLANGGSEFLYDLEHVPDGTYRIYDVTGVRRDSLWSKAADTGVSVRVNGADTEVDVIVDGADEEATVDYYTVTFYDEDDPYGTDTDQRPQVVLKGKAAVRPNDPGKADHVFEGWVTAKDGSTPFDFTNTKIGDTTGIYASWRIEDTATDIIIEASASEGGSISPAGSVSVERGTDKTFTITPNDGYHIKSVSADGQEVTAEGEGTSRTYTFRNVTENHAIHATFERNSGGDTPGGDDGDNKPGGGDNPPDGTTGDNGGGSTPDKGNDPSGGSSGTDDSNSDTTSDDSDSNTVSGSTVITANTENNTAAVTTDNSAGGSTAATNTGNPAASNSPQGKEPKTGDATYVEMYATVAMIAGLAYILLYFMDADRGMTEREKEVYVAAFIRWAKRGSGIRKYFALAAIFCLLVYYHSIGKRVRADWKEAYIK